MARIRTVGRFGWLATSAGAQVVSATTGLITNVVYARQLTLAQFGVVAVANSFAAWFAVVGDRGLGAWITREAAIAGLRVRSAVLIAARASVAPLAFITLVATLLSITGVRVAHGAWLALALSASIWLYQLGLSLAQGFNSPHLRAMAIASNGALTFVATVGLLHYHPSAELAVFLSMLGYGGVGVGLILAVRRISARHVGTASDASGARAVREARGLYFSNTVAYALSSADVIVASALGGNGGAAVYQVAKKVSQGLVLPFIATLPMLLGRLARTDRGNHLRQAAGLAFAGCAAIGLGITVLGTIGEPLLRRVFGVDFEASASFLTILSAAFAYQFLRDLIATIFNARGEYGVAARANLISLVIFAMGLVGFQFLGVGERIAVALACGFAVGVLYEGRRLSQARDSGKWSSLPWQTCLWALAIVATVGHFSF